MAMLDNLSISNFIGYLKEKGTLMIYGRHSELQSKILVKRILPRDNR